MPSTVLEIKDLLDYLYDDVSDDQISKIENALKAKPDYQRMLISLTQLKNDFKSRAELEVFLKKKSDSILSRIQRLLAE